MLTKKLIAFANSCLLLIVIATTAFASDKPKVAFIIASDDLRSAYNQGILSGIQRELTQGEISNITYDIPKNHSDYIGAIEKAIKNGADIVITYSIFMQDAGLKMAKKYPGKKFFLIDVDYTKDETPSNLYTMKFNEYEGGFIVGALIGMLTGDYYTSIEGLNEERTVGIIKGVDTPAINLIEDGFKEGVAYVCSDCEVLSNTIDSFTDNYKGYDVAQNMYKNGADIIFPIIGSAGSGVIDSSKQNKKFMIGIDTDMFNMSNTVITSATKDLPYAVATTLKGIISGDAKSSHQYVYGVGNGGIKLSPFHDYDSKIPQEVKNKLAQIIADIKSGKIITN